MMTPTFGEAFADRTRRLEAVHLGHPDVDEGDVGLVLLDQLEELLAVRGLSDDLDPVRHVEVPPQPLAHEGVVVSNGYLDGHPFLLDWNPRSRCDHHPSSSAAPVRRCSTSSRKVA